MAGSYPDPPSWRLPIDWLDTVEVVYWETYGNFVAFSASQMYSLSYDDNAAATLTVGYDPWHFYHGIHCVFRQPMDIDAIKIRHDLSSILMYFSSDTTNGFDGTWTSSLISATNDSNFRTTTVSVGRTNVRAMRFTTGDNATFRQLHIYGEPSAGYSPHRLVFWDGIANTPLAPARLDWGDVPRRSSEDRQVWVKNVSTTKLAESVVLTARSIQGQTPRTLDRYLYFSLDGVNFFGYLDLGDLSAGSVKGPITVRRVVPNEAFLGSSAHRLEAKVGAWV